MKEKIAFFFTGVFKSFTDYLEPNSKILITSGATSYTVEFKGSGKVNVEEKKKDGEIEIVGEESVITDLFSSSNMEEYLKKICFYIEQNKKPMLRILMNRNIENTKKFIRNYYIPLFKLYIIH